MTITVDGERSRKRLPVAKKALANIIEMGLPAKGGMYEGFFYKVWQMGKGEISGGRVVAPLGIYILHVGKWGFKQFVCDSTQCAALPVYEPFTIDGDRYLTVYETAPTGYSVYAPGGANGVPVLASPHVGLAPDPSSQWKPPQPVCIPFGGEYVEISATFERTSGHWVECSLATHCLSDGRADVQAHGISGIAPFGGTSGASSHRVAPLLTTQGYLERLLWKMGVPYYATYLSGQPALFVEYQYYYAPTQVSGVPLRVTGSDTFGGASAAFQAKLAYHVGGSPLLAHVHGHFGSRIANDVKGVLASRVYNYATQSCTAEQIADPNHNCISYAADSNWLLTLTFYSVLSGKQVVGYDVLGPALAALAAGEFSWVYGAAPDNYESTPEKDSWVLRRLFGYGADDETSTYGTLSRDTATFADADGVVYSWLRCTDPSATQRGSEAGVGAKLGGFKFQAPQGFVRTALTMPAEVLADATLRPRIMLMTASTYHCIADRANGEIAHLYVGSPFGSWQEIALPSGVVMYSIRVLQPGDTAAATGFVAIGKDAAGMYRVYMMLAGSAWVALSPIPAPDVDDMIASWDVCVFGDDPLVAASQQVRQHPVAVQSRRPELR